MTSTRTTSRVASVRDAGRSDANHHRALRRCGSQTTTDGYVGRRVLRVEDLRLLTGRGRYIDDLDRDQQLYASFVRSGVAHGRIRSIDVEAATAPRPASSRVFTAEQLPDVRIPVRLIPTETSLGALQPALARDRVRYVGDPVAVVVAEDPYVAEDGAEDVVVDIEPLDAELDPVAAFEGRGDAPARRARLEPDRHPQREEGPQRRRRVQARGGRRLRALPRPPPRRRPARAARPAGRVRAGRPRG